MNPVNWAVVKMFENPNIALWLAGGIIVAAAIIITFNKRKHHTPFLQALKIRLAATDFIESSESEDEAQAALVSHFSEVDRAMSSKDGKSAELRHAWTQYKETIVDETQSTLLATTRPEGYFLHLGDDTRVLAWWANIFVAVGLTFTFLGIVAALLKAVEAMSQSANPANMQSALIGLLTITAVKFWTSIAGVGSSIALRWFDRRWHSGTTQLLETLCDRLEYSTLFSPPQRLAAAQLNETREQTTALKTFSHELAIAIGEQFENRMQPMVSVLGGIQQSINDFKDGSFNQIGKELGEALSRNAGSEMEQLASALTTMTGGLSSIHEKLEGSGQAVNDQIANAARDFSVASEQMTKAFADLNDRIETMADRMVGEAAATSERAAAHVSAEREAYKAVADDNRRVMQAMAEEMRTGSTTATNDMVRAVREAVESATSHGNDATRSVMENFAQASNDIQTAFEAMRGQIAEYGTTLTSSASDAAARNSQVLEGAAAALEAATSRASSGMAQAIDDAVVRASEESARALSSAFEQFSGAFSEASLELVQTLRGTASRMEALGAGIDKSTRATDEHATRLIAAGTEAQGVAVMLGRAANDLHGASVPIREATASINSSVGRTEALLKAAGETAEKNREAVADIASRLGETTEAASNAWSDYRSRFEEVDKALAGAINQIKTASMEHAGNLNEQVGKIDSAMAQAVDRLARSLDSLEDLASSLDDLRNRLPVRA